MKLLLLIALIVLSSRVTGQQYNVTGSVSDERNNPLKYAEIKLSNTEALKLTTTTGKDGNYAFKLLTSGTYHLRISAYGYEEINDSFRIDKGAADGTRNIGLIQLHPVAHMLDEVKVAAKTLSVAQKVDTVEFYSSAFKVNPDADATDLIAKMPSIEVNGNSINAQGDAVIKVLVDGKPFFGNDPYAALKNLPADIIQKVQVYNEKNYQERLNGFSEQATSKTINIITKGNKKNGVFGNVYGGGGSGLSSQGAAADNNAKFGVGGVINRFQGDNRISLTSHSNNINSQNFTEKGPLGSTGGLTESTSAGLNYSRKWDDKIDISSSYVYSQTKNSQTRNLDKIFVLPVDSGQIYQERNNSSNNNNNHQFNVRINYVIDSMNTLVVNPQMSFSKRSTGVDLSGNTNDGFQTINQTSNKNATANSGFSFSNVLFLGHKFHTIDRSFSLTLNTSNNSSNSVALFDMRNVYYASPSLNDTLDQQGKQSENTWNIAATTTYTEPIGKNGLLKLDYNLSHIPQVSEKNTSNYSYATRAYSLTDSRYSNSFYCENTTHKTGVSYLFRTKKSEFSFGVYYQLTELKNRQTLPVANKFSHTFNNILPVATYHYKISGERNIQCTYSTGTQPLFVSQLQPLVNNTDPLHLYTGNPLLKQPYQYKLSVHYNVTNLSRKTNLSASLSGDYTQHAVTTGSMIAQNDTLVASGNILLPKGSQLTMPENVDGAQNFTANINYGMPLELLKCNIKFLLNAGIAHQPSVINNVVNFQDNKNGRLGVILSSNMSQNIDFLVTFNTAIVSNANSINKKLNAVYINNNCMASLNVVFWKNTILNTRISYQSNPGLPSGYNKDYLIWNMSIGKKIFRKQSGTIKLSVVDMLNENRNIQQVITEAYIQSIRANALQRYFMVIFIYKISNFK